MSLTYLGLRLSIYRVAAKYKNKKKVKSQDGGETTIYEYGPRQIANRHKEKADRIEKFLPKLPDLRAKYRKDLDSKDPEKRLTALAVALIDHTYERVGNVGSAEENGHYGVTVWEARHVKFKGNKAEISYTGKSGVDHVKTVDDEKIVKALKAAVKDKKPKDRILCDGKDCTVGSSHVNDYLRPYEVTAKDLRGLHANEEVRKRLTEIRKNGPELPRARKDKDKILKKEFQEALEGAAEAVGHEPATLRGQYLVPGLEDSYLHDGTVMEKLNKKAFLELTAARKKGDCYAAAGKFFMDNCFSSGSGMVLVHGEVAGQGALAGTNFGHAWVEHNGMVIDKSNGRDIRIPVVVYYAIGGIDRIDNTHRYTWDQASNKIEATGHWGPWDLKTSTGL
jgi:DNA topoisomerase IB